jgi:putative hydrolase of the HAD superfamily
VTTEATTRAVLFDFYGTLARATAWGPTYEEVLAGHGYSVTETVLGWLHDDGLFDGQEHLEHSCSRERYRAWELARLRAMALRCGVGPDDVDALVADLDRAGKTFTMTAYDDAIPTLAELRERGLVLAVCSNWDWDLDRALDATGIAPLVDHQVNSARVGARKPHARIFQHTLSRCGVAPGEALFVGDSWKCDVEGPLAHGMRAVHVWRQDGDPPSLLEGVCRVADLGALLHVLGSE